MHRAVCPPHVARIHTGLVHDMIFFFFVCFPSWHPAQVTRPYSYMYEALVSLISPGIRRIGGIVDRIVGHLGSPVHGPVAPRSEIGQKWSNFEAILRPTCLHDDDASAGVAARV